MRYDSEGNVQPWGSQSKKTKTEQPKSTSTETAARNLKDL